MRENGRIPFTLCAFPIEPGYEAAHLQTFIVVSKMYSFTFGVSGYEAAHLQTSVRKS